MKFDEFYLYRSETAAAKTKKKERNVKSVKSGAKLLVPSTSVPSLGLPTAATARNTRKRTQDPNTTTQETNKNDLSHAKASISYTYEFLFLFCNFIHIYVIRSIL